MALIRSLFERDCTRNVCLPGGVHLRNDKGVMIVLQGPKAGLEFAANLSGITIALK